MTYKWSRLCLMRSNCFYHESQPLTRNTPLPFSSALFDYSSALSLPLSLSPFISLPACAATVWFAESLHLRAARWPVGDNLNTFLWMFYSGWPS